MNHDERDFEEKFEAIFNNGLIGILVLDDQSTVIKVNQSFVDMLGYDSPDEWVGKSIRELHLTDEFFNEFSKRFNKSLVYHEYMEIDYQIKSKDGTPVWVAVSGRAIDRSMPADLTKGVIWMARDISKRKNLEGKLSRQMRTDELTGVISRGYFMEIGKREIARMNRYGKSLSLLLMDIDHFKDINSNEGHNIGNLAINYFAEMCGKIVRNTDILGRLGGEEFVVLMPESNLEQAVSTGERIRQQLIECTSSHNVIPSMTVSMGAVQMSNNETLDHALNRADTLLHKAKNEGRNKVEGH